MIFFSIEENELWALIPRYHPFLWTWPGPIQMEQLPRKPVDLQWCTWSSTAHSPFHLYGKTPHTSPSWANESSDFAGIVSPNPIHKFIELDLKSG